MCTSTGDFPTALWRQICCPATEWHKILQLVCQSEDCHLPPPPCVYMQVVAQLWVAVVGVLLLFSATSWLYGYLAAQAAHAARDMQELTTSPQSAMP